MGPLTLVRETCAYVASQSTHVAIDEGAVQRVADGIGPAEMQKMLSAGFDSALHYFDGGPLTAQYLLVLDALNFCFWPQPGLEYEHLASGLKASLEEDEHVLDAALMAAMDGPGVQALLRRRVPLPAQEERARLLREVGEGLLEGFGGRAVNLVHAADRSASRLVTLLTATFPGFRDHSIYGGRQVFLYKRAQIFVGDMWGAFGGLGLGSFHDIGRLTTFADYRVPVVLRHMGILRYSPSLAAKVDDQEELPAGSVEEVELRACTVAAVEQLRQALAAKHLAVSSAEMQSAASMAQAEAGLKLVGDIKAERTAGNGGVAVSHKEEFRPISSCSRGDNELPNSVQLDWWLWEQGEKNRATDPPHHRTVTIYY